MNEISGSTTKVFDSKQLNKSIDNTNQDKSPKNSCTRLPICSRFSQHIRNNAALFNKCNSKQTEYNDNLITNKEATLSPRDRSLLKIASSGCAEEIPNTIKSLDNSLSPYIKKNIFIGVKPTKTSNIIIKHSEYIDKSSRILHKVLNDSDSVRNSRKDAPDSNRLIKFRIQNVMLSQSTPRENCVQKIQNLKNQNIAQCDQFQTYKKELSAEKFAKIYNKGQ